MRISPKTKSGSKTEAAHSPSVAVGDSSLSEGAFDLCDFRLYAAKNKTSPAAATAALFKGRLFLCKSYGCRAWCYQSVFRFFVLPASGRSPLFCGFSSAKRGFPFRAARTESTKMVWVFASPKYLYFSESHPRPYTCAAPPARSHCHRHSDSSPESPQPFCRLPDRSR